MNTSVVSCFSSSLLFLCCLSLFFPPHARQFPLLLVFAWDEWEIDIVCADIHKLTECETHAGDGWQHCCVRVCVCSFRDARWANTRFWPWPRSDPSWSGGGEVRGKVEVSSQNGSPGCLGGIARRTRPSTRDLFGGSGGWRNVGAAERAKRWWQGFTCLLRWDFKVLSHWAASVRRLVGRSKLWESKNKEVIFFLTCAGCRGLTLLIKHTQMKLSCAL